MISSMTGYGRATTELDAGMITVEMRTVNHRFLDITIKAPHQLLFLEDKITELVKTHFVRGRIDIYLTLPGTHNEAKQIQVDWELLDQYVHEMKRAQKRYQLSEEIPVTLLTALPDFFSITEPVEQPNKMVSDAVLTGLEEACQHVLLARETEGRFLQRDLSQRLDNLADVVQAIDKRKESVKKAYQDRMKVRIEEQLRDLIALDETRLLSEIALLAEKGDITEEITRMLSHHEHVKRVIAKGGAVGRTIDFIVQEMHREANTIGAKSIDPTISEHVVELKGEIEKIREQIQNIE